MNPPEVWMSSSPVLCADAGEQREINRFFSELDKDLLLFFTLQILWLRSRFAGRLGNEFAGNYGDGKPATVPMAALALCKVAKYRQAQVKPHGQGRLPMVEGLIRFQRVTYSFLPDGRPALFLPGKQVITYRQLRDQGRSPNQTINYVLRRLKGAT